MAKLAPFGSCGPWNFLSPGLPKRIELGINSVCSPFSALMAARVELIGSAWILACSLRIASSSISGRGGQPGR